MIDNSKYSIILPGRIVSYDASDQTATVKVSAERVYSTSFVDDEVLKRNNIEGVPVHTPSGGGWSITMPITAGDTCLLFFSQVGYDHWLYEDKDEAGTLASLPKPWLGRQFNEDDGIALVGINTLPRAIQNQSSSDSQWRNSDASQKISLNSDGSISIDSGAQTVTVTGSKLVVNGDLEVNGEITSTGGISSEAEVTANSMTVPVNLSVHTHTTTTTGNPTSPPLP